jgi:ABC-2 type transport system permease protein
VNAIGIVFSAEFVRRLTSRAFIVATLLGAISIVLIAVLPKIIAGDAGIGSNTIVLVGDPTLTTPAKALLRRDFAIAATLPRLQALPTVSFLNGHGKAAAVAVLERRSDGLHVTAYARDPSSFRGQFARDLAPLQVALGTGVPLEQVRRHTRVPVEVHDIAGRFASETSALVAKGIAYLFTFLLYLAILLNAQSIMASVAEEKTSRIAELLVATIDPAQLLAAKILASGATAMIQLAVWLATGALTVRAAAGMFLDSDSSAGLHPQSAALTTLPLTLPTGEMLAFIAFFALGFIQFGVLYAAGASLINRTEDLGSVAGPLVVPVVIGFLLAQVSLINPNASNVVICSQIPLLAPFVMFTRIAVSSVPAWQIVLSLVLNVSAAVLLAWAAGKIYRVGLLLYGRPPSLRQVVAALRT